MRFPSDLDSSCSFSSMVSFLLYVYVCVCVYPCGVPLSFFFLWFFCRVRSTWPLCLLFAGKGAIAIATRFSGSIDTVAFTYFSYSPFPILISIYTHHVNLPLSPTALTYSSYQNFRGKHLLGFSLSECTANAPANALELYLTGWCAGKPAVCFSALWCS